MIYLSGKISDGDKEESTFERFNEAESLLKSEGYEVFNPASFEEENRSWEYYLARDLLWIVENEPTLYMLKGWEESKGARLEFELASLLELEIKYEGILA